MNQFRDRELDRLLNNADDLLSNITVYETTTEENARKQEEEAVRLQAEAEQRILEEQQRAAESSEPEEQQHLAEILEQEQKLAEAKAAGQEAAETWEQEAQSAAATLEQEDEFGDADAIERELAEAEALMRELSLAEVDGLEQKHQSAEVAVLEQKRGGQAENALFGCSLFSILCFMYMEVIAHLSIYGSIDTKILYPLLFAAGIGCMTAVLSSFFSKRWNTVLFCILLVLCSLYYDLQILCHAVCETFLTLTDIPAGIQMLIQQGEAVIPGMTAVLPGLVLMFLPILLWAVPGRNWIRFEQSRWWNRLLVMAAGIIVVIVGILCLDIHGYEAGSPYVCFYHFDSETQLEETGRQLGVTAVTGLELLEQFQR